MHSDRTVPWWHRLLLAAAATLFTLFLVVALIAIQSFWREPNLHWFNWAAGGGIRVPAALFVVCGTIALALYAVVAVPLVLLWTVQSQLKHWYAFLGVALLLPLAVFSKPWRHPGSNPHDILYAAEHLVFAVLPILCGAACYLLLLRHRQARLSAAPTPTERSS